MICPWCGEPVDEHDGDLARACLLDLAAAMECDFDDDDQLHLIPVEIDGPTYREMFCDEPQRSLSLLPCT